MSIAAVSSWFAMFGATVTFEIMRDMLERQLTGFLTPPIRQYRADRLGVFKTGNVVAGVATIF